MLKDLRYAARMLAKSPGFTAVAVCSLAIGIGANSAVFSFADALLLRPLPVMKPNGIVTVNPGSTTFGDSNAVSYPDYAAFRDHNRSFSGLLAFSYEEFGYAQNRSAVPQMAFGAAVSGNFFKVLGVEPTLGRGFRPAEDQVPGRDHVAVLGHDFWLSQFNGSPSAIGSTIRLNGLNFTVVGVAPASFTGMDQFLKPSVYVPLAMSPALTGTDNMNKRDVRWLVVKGRLKPGVTTARAAADLNSIEKVLQQTYSSEPRSQKIRVETELALRMEESPPDTGLIEMLMVLALCVLLVACANVGGLLLSRSAARGREVAVRMAIGAARWQLVRQLFLENLLLALAGAVLGIEVAQLGIELFSKLPIPTDVPISFNVTLDQRVLVFTLIISVASTFLFGLAPAWRTSRTDVVSALKARDTDLTRKGRFWARNVLVSSQVAVSLLLLIVSAVIFTGFRKELAAGPGFQTDHAYLMTLDSQMVHYTAAQTQRFYRELLGKARSTPSVQSAALASFIPFDFSGDSKAVVPQGQTLRPNERPATVFDSIVSDGYFRTMHIPILRGRAFSEYDKQDSPLVPVVNEHFASHFWPHQEPVGKLFHLDGANGPLVQVVGVAKQGRYFWVAEQPLDFIYLPLSQHPTNAMTLIAESATPNPAALAPTLRALVHNMDPNMPVFDARTLQDLFTKRAVEFPRVIVEAIAGMGAMAFVLALIGLYGLIAYSVSRRTREIGIRIAVGADRRSVLQMVLRQGFMLAASGAAMGLVLGVAASRLLGSQVVLGFGNPNPALFAAIAVPLLLVALLAAYAPARRASHIEPMQALHEE